MERCQLYDWTELWLPILYIYTFRPCDGRFSILVPYVEWCRHHPWPLRVYMTQISFIWKPMGLKLHIRKTSRHSTVATPDLLFQGNPVDLFYSCCMMSALINSWHTIFETIHFDCQCYWNINLIGTRLQTSHSLHKSFQKHDHSPSFNISISDFHLNLFIFRLKKRL